LIDLAFLIHCHHLFR
jgi:hypothetical protein